MRKGALDLIWALRNAGNVDLRIVTMNLEGAGVIKAIADKLHEDAVAAASNRRRLTARRTFHRCR